VSVVEFIVIVFFLELTPGPNMAYLAMLTLTRGRLAGLVAVSGILAGLAVHVAVAALGIWVLIEKIPLVYEVLRWTGVAYLFYLAWEGWRTEKPLSLGKADFETMAGPLFWRGFFSNIFNPKSIVFFVSVVPRFIDAAPGAMPAPVQMISLGGLSLGIATAIHVFIVLLASHLRPYLVKGRRYDITRKILAGALALVAVWLVWTTRR
jgi:threonine/homoserine/homoserine lactone efflux protein